MWITRVAGGLAEATGMAVRVARQSGPGVAGPVLVVVSVGQWSWPLAGVLAGLLLWGHDVVTGLQERAELRARPDRTHTRLGQDGPR